MYTHIRQCGKYSCKTTLMHKVNKLIPITGVECACVWLIVSVCGIPVYVSNISGLASLTVVVDKKIRVSVNQFLLLTDGSLVFTYSILVNSKLMSDEHLMIATSISA